MLFHHKLALCVSGAALVAAQNQFAYTDAATNVKLQAQKVTENIKGGFQFGVAFPQTLGADDYIGNIIGARVDGAGWSGINHGAGMLDNLMIIAWADGNDIKTSLRIAQYYRAPVLYAHADQIKITPLSKVVNATHFNLLYRCQGCFNWDFNGKHYNQSLTGDVVNFSFAQSSKPVKTPSYPSSPILMHNNGYGVLAFNPKPAAEADFQAYVSKAPATPKVRRYLDARSPQIPVASNRTATPNRTVTLPKFSPTTSPTLGLEEPRIPIPVSSASTAIASLENLTPKPAPATSVVMPAMPTMQTAPTPLPKLPIPKGGARPLLPLFPLPKGSRPYPKGPKGTGVRPKGPKGTGVRPRPHPLPVKMPKRPQPPKAASLITPTPLLPIATPMA